jgi:hypothetical protein
VLEFCLCNITNDGITRLTAAVFKFESQRTLFINNQKQAIWRQALQKLTSVSTAWNTMLNCGTQVDFEVEISRMLCNRISKWNLNCARMLLFRAHWSSNTVHSRLSVCKWIFWSQIGANNSVWFLIFVHKNWVKNCLKNFKRGNLYL